MKIGPYYVPLSLISSQLNLAYYEMVMGPADDETSKHISLFGSGTPAETVRLLVAIGCIVKEGRQHGWTQRYFDSRLRSLIIYNTSFPDRALLNEVLIQAVVLTRI